MKKSKNNTKTSGRLRILASIILLIVFIALVGFAFVYAFSPSLFETGNETASHNSYNSETSTKNETEEQSQSITPEEAYAHAQIVSTVEAQNSNETLAETDVVKLLKDRGFNDVIVNTSYGMDGTYFSDTQIDENSTDKHPAYTTIFVSENGNYWTLLIYDGQIMANPVTYNSKNTATANVIFSEKESITSYFSATNTFYKIIPDGTEYKVKVIGRIDAETLNNMQSGEIGSL